MRTCKTLTEAIKQAQNIASTSNQGEIDLFFCLSNISMNDLWKKDSFYAGIEELKHYRSKKFGALMHDIFNRSTTWFRNMDHILQLSNGQSLYLKHGHRNMVAYMGFSPEHKEFVLKAALKRPLANFHSLLSAAGMKGGTNLDITKEKEITWRKKYKKLEKRFNTLQTKYKTAQKENGILRKKLNGIEKLFSK